MGLSQAIKSSISTRVYSDVKITRDTLDMPSKASASTERNVQTRTKINSFSTVGETRDTVGSSCNHQNQVAT